jgi:hypothetical protein
MRGFFSAGAGWNKRIARMMIQEKKVGVIDVQVA